MALSSRKPVIARSGSLADIDDGDMAVLELEESVSRMVHTASMMQMVVPASAVRPPMPVHSRATQLWKVGIVSVRWALRGVVNNHAYRV